MNFKLKNMKIKFCKVIPLIALACLLSACKNSQLTLPYYSFETECLGVELDGSQTLRVWGKGRNKADAEEQAKKNAVRDVLFKGITAGTGECNKRPLIMEVNAQEKYEYYFNVFFKDGGAYKKYVSMEDRKGNSTVGASSGTQDIYGLTVRVLRSELRQRLIDDDIIKP